MCLWRAADLTRLYFRLIFAENRTVMNSISRQQQKEFARILYMRENLTQAEIAERTGVSRQTIIRWIATEKWDELKAAVSMSTEDQIRSLYRQIVEINNAITDKEPGSRFASAKEADTILKLTTAINKLQTEAGIHEIVNVGAEFIEYIRRLDLEKAQEFAQLFNSFIKSKLEAR